MIIINLSIKNLLSKRSKTLRSQLFSLDDLFHTVDFASFHYIIKNHFELLKEIK